MKFFWFSFFILNFYSQELVLGQSLCDLYSTRASHNNQWEFQAENLLSKLLPPYHSKFGVSPAITITEDRFPQASTSASNIIKISSGLMYQIDKEEELAFVIAHEISHLILGHVHLNKPQTLAEFTTRELGADKMAVKLLKDAQINTNGGRDILGKFIQKTDISATYPTLTNRLTQLSYLSE